MRPRGLWFMLGGITLLGMAAASYWRFTPTGAAADSVIVGDAQSGLDRAANSPTLAIDPRDDRVMLLAERIDRPGFSCALYRSADGGEHWNPVRVPLPTHYDTCYAPDVAFDSRGNATLIFLTLNTHPKDPLSAGNDPNGAWLTHSDNGGKSFETPRRVLGPDHIQVRIAADPSANRLYLLWLEGSDLENHTPLGLGPPPNPLKLAVSGDSGRTFSAPVQVNAAKHVRVGAASMAIAADGTVNVLFEDFGSDLNDYNNRALPFQGKFSLLLARSTNHGASFAESLIDSNVVRAAPFLIYLPPLPALALDATGQNIFAAWQDGRGGAPDILLRHSTDSGKTWSRLARLNQRSTDPSEALLPALSVAADGRLDAVFLDARPSANALATNVMYVQSKDDGTTFTPPVPLTRRPFDGFVGPLNPRTQAIDFGTRLALRSTLQDVRAAWPDSRLGTPDTGRQEIAFAKIAVPQD
ncbi:MAG: glycoside hydrolase, partial [Candidatus Eremiobacteraeota bacterium]|nr:glycoside hydrolase [Candidatus Eremiobacteraeota bacterium]